MPFEVHSLANLNLMSLSGLFPTPSSTSRVIITPRIISEVMADPSRIAIASQLKMMFRQPTTIRIAKIQSQISKIGRAHV